MYPRFHPPTFIQPSTHRPGYQHPRRRSWRPTRPFIGWDRAARGEPPCYRAREAATRRFGGWGRADLPRGFLRRLPPFCRLRRRPASAGRSSSRRQAIKLAARPIDHSSGTHNFCMHLNLLNLLLTFPHALIAATGSYDRRSPEPIPRRPTFVSATTSLGATLSHSSPHW